MTHKEEFPKTAIQILVGILRNVSSISAVPGLGNKADLVVRKTMGPFTEPNEMFQNDGVVQVHSRHGPRWIVLEVKINAQLRDVKIAVDRIARFAGSMGAPGYGVFACPYLTQAAKDYCIEKGVGYFDLSGNCRLVFDEVYIEKEVPLTVAPEKKRLRSLFSDKSARVIRRLLENPTNAWRVQTLAGTSNVSKATVSLLKDKLIDSGYAEPNSDGSFQITKPETLLLDWARYYSSHEHTQLECYGRGDLPENEAKFVAFCQQQPIDYAFTMFSGARRIAPFTRGVDRSHVYVVSEKPLNQLAEELSFKIVDSGGNFRLIAPADDDILYGSHLSMDVKIVSDIQLYLDLAGHKGRGEENAEFLLNQRIRKTWPNPSH